MSGSNESIESKLKEMLSISKYLGSGPRYLLCYYGQLAITNGKGFKSWPEGPKVIIAIIQARECVDGLSPVRKIYLLKKLSSLDAL